MDVITFPENLYRFYCMVLFHTQMRHHVINVSLFGSCYKIIPPTLFKIWRSLFWKWRAQMSYFFPSSFSKKSEMTYARGDQNHHEPHNPKSPYILIIHHFVTAVWSIIVVFISKLQINFCHFSHIVNLDIFGLHYYQCTVYAELIWEHSGSVIECLTWDRGAAGSRLTSVTVLWSLSKAHLS